MKFDSAIDPIERLDTKMAPAKFLTQIANATRGTRKNAPGPNFFQVSEGTNVQR